MLRYVPLIAVASVLIAACGGSSPTVTGGSGSASTARANGVKLAECMRSHGVPNFPDPGASSGGGIQIQASQRSGSGQTMTVNGVPVSAPAFQSAMNVCGKELPNPHPISASQVAGIRRAALKMAACMRSHGVPNFPDPTVQSGPNGGIGIKIGGPGSNIDPQSPAFQAAQKTCKQFLQQAGGPSGP